MIAGLYALSQCLDKIPSLKRTAVFKFLRRLSSVLDSGNIMLTMIC